MKFDSLETQSDNVIIYVTFPFYFSDIVNMINILRCKNRRNYFNVTNCDFPLNQHIEK